MYDPLFLITSGFFFVSLLANLLMLLKLWESKDFNLKRLLVHLKETKRGKDFLWGPISILKWLLIFLYSVTIFSGTFDNYYHFIVFGVYLLIFIQIAKKIIGSDIEIPTFTPVAISIFFLTLIVGIAMYTLSPLDQFLWLIIIDKFLPVLVGLFVMILSVFFDFENDAIYNKALSKIESHNNLLTIAVLGSYGRGSTKEFINRLLSMKFNVLETKASFSNSLGIARTIISGLTSKKQIFIAEVDDYKSNDVREMSSLVSPKIAVFTGINNQKISIFGSMEKILESKQQAIDGLSRDGIALFNGNDDNTVSLSKKTKKKKFIYAVEKNADIIASNLKEQKYTISFDVTVFGKKYKLSKVKLLGGHNVENLLPAIFIATYVGIDFPVQKKALLSLVPLPGAMEPRKTVKGVSLINDTHNVNINSVLRVLSYMKLYKGKKILVLEPLEELGSKSAEEHLRLGEKIGQVCDVVFITNENYFDSLAKGINNAKTSCVFSVTPPSKIAKYVDDNCGNDDVVVFEGRGAQNSLSLIRSEAIYPK